MRKILILAVGALLIACAANAQATCPGDPPAPIVLKMGDAPKHLTVIDKATCTQVGPLTVSGTASAVYVLSKDGTGFLVAPVALGFDNIIFSAPGYTNAVPVSVTIIPAAAHGVTS